MKQVYSFFFLCCLLVTNSFAQTVFTDYGDLRNAIKTAKAGDEFILADGVYDAESLTFDALKGTVDKPIIVRAETIGGVILNDNVYFDIRNSEYVTIQGFVFNLNGKPNVFKIQTSNYIRVTQNVFDGTNEPAGTSTVWINIQSMWDNKVDIGHHNRIDHNVMKNKQTLGNMIRIDGTDSKFVSQYNVIDYNYFKNMGPRATNEMEVIRVGWSSMSKSDGFNRIENNLFEECNGDPEIVSVKCNQNIIAHNTFRRCEGTLSLRHGNGSTIDGNFFLGEGFPGTGGVRIYGSDHRIVNNYFEGLTGTKWDAPITLTKGDAEEGNGDLTKHFRIERAIIANNTLVNNSYGIEIGFDNGGNYTKPARNVVMAYNIISGSQNALVKYISAPDAMVWFDNVFYATDAAKIGEGVSFTENQVISQDPRLIFNSALAYFVATVETPKYTPSLTSVGEVKFDMEGQLRDANTNYGADQFSASPLVYKVLNPIDVGPETGAYLNTSVSIFNMPRVATKLDLMIESNVNWKLTSDAEWLTVDRTTGSLDAKVQVMASENTTGSIRTALLYLESTSGNESILKQIQVSQSERDVPFLIVSNNSFDFQAAAETETLTINSNLAWTVVSSASWLTVSNTSRTGTQVLDVVVEENTRISPRKATLTITGEELSEVLEISQAGRVGTEVKLVVTAVTPSTEQVENEAIHLIDDNYTNRWSGDGDGAEVTFDLGAIAKLSYVKIGLYMANSRTSTFDVLTSEDGLTFNPVLSNITTEITTETIGIYDFTDVKARYVRLVGHGNSGSTWNSYTEFEIWGWTDANHGGITNSFSPTQNKPLDLVFPSPSNGSFTLRNSEFGKLSVYDMTGKLSFFTLVNQLNSPISTGLTQGVYVVVFSSSTSNKVGRLIVK